ncbi:MAG: polyprenyl synthetase family protein [Planctomycetota bacterium]|nr:MAG: polyprenyl synthetase family protein [Planctomycetota bacterium]
MPETPSPTLESILSRIRPELARVDRWLDRQFEPDHPALAPLLAHAARFRGKRIRAAQVLLVGSACGGLTEAHIAVAGIIEMIHAATLVHDDLLDEAEQRRGLACVHLEWGSHTAVLLGDWIYARAFQRSTELDDPTCSRVLARATGRVCRGEIHQNLTRGDFELTEEDYLAQIDGKTAALYQAGGFLAAHYAGAGGDLAAAAGRHGLLAGRAFQIIDDVLDLEGDEERTGKSLGTDWARGKMTLPLIRLRDRLTGPERRRLGQAFGSGADRSVLFRGEFADPLREEIEATKSEAMRLLDEAAGALAPLPAHPAREALLELTRFLGTRRR